MREITRDESDRRAEAGEPFVVRFRVPRGSGRIVQFHDGVFRKQSRKIDDIEDFALLRTDGSPKYHLASTVDVGEFTAESVEHELRQLTEERGAKAGLLINGARAALSGQSVGPSAFAVFATLGRERVVKRLKEV